MGWVMFTEVSAGVSAGTVASKVAGYVASFLFDESGSSIVESVKKKIDRQKFKKRERVLFEYYFRDVKDEQELKIIFDFIDGKVVLDNLWYSHEDKISIEQQDSLWLEFQNFKKHESGDSYAPLEYKEKLSKCANFHNKLVNEIILSEKDHFVINTLLNKQKEMTEAMTEAMKIATKEATKEVMKEVMEEATKEVVKEEMGKTTSKKGRTALSNKDSSHNFSVKTTKKYVSWVTHTVLMGCLPFIIKLLMAYVSGIILSPNDFWTELFFITIVFLIDAIKNFDDSGNDFANLEKLAMFVLILSASVYSFSLTTQFDAPISGLIVFAVFLLLGFLFDFISIQIK